MSNVAQELHRIISTSVRDMLDAVRIHANAIGLGGDLPVLVAKLKAATAQVEALRASLASAQTVADRWGELDPEDLAAELRLTQGWSQDFTADRKVLRALGVTITVDRPLKEAIIQGNLVQIVASRLSSDAQFLWEARG